MGSGMCLGKDAVVVISTNHYVDVEGYKSRLEAVLGMINNGTLGGGFGYGCDEHKKALCEVERQINETWKHIREMDDHLEEPDELQDLGLFCDKCFCVGCFGDCAGGD